MKPKLCNLEPPVVLGFGILMVLYSISGCVSFNSKSRLKIRQKNWLHWYS